MLWVFFICVALGAYLMGSLPTGYIVGRWRGVDLRHEGSSNIGATNALRVLGKKWGYLVFAVDLLKGMLAVKIAYGAAQYFYPEHVIPAGIVAAFCVMIGHIFPVWLGFKGGKGISTSGGIMIGLFPIWVFLFGVILWIVVFLVTRYVSVASIAAAFSLPFSSGILALWGLCDPRLVVIAALMCVLAVWRHKPNIERLLAGTEKKFEKKNHPAQS